MFVLCSGGREQSHNLRCVSHAAKAENWKLTSLCWGMSYVALHTALVRRLQFVSVWYKWIWKQTEKQRYSIKVSWRRYLALIRHWKWCAGSPDQLTSPSWYCTLSRWWKTKYNNHSWQETLCSNPVHVLTAIKMWKILLLMWNIDIVNSLMVGVGPVVAPPVATTRFAQSFSWGRWWSTL